MKKLYTNIFFIIFILCASCSSNSPETAASSMLESARKHLQDERYDAARDSIMSMRKQHPTAIEARRQGILLLDSIEMLAAKDSLCSATGEEWKRLSMKVQFFERKLKEDIKKQSK